MNAALLRLHVKLQDLIHREEGQDLVEYALVIALIALSATIGMKDLASGIKNAFNSVSSVLATDI